MLLNIISLLLIVGSLAAVFFIVSRYSEVLSSIDVDTLPQEKESEIKDKLIKDRIVRKMRNLRDFLAILRGPLTSLATFIAKPFHRGYASLAAAREAHKKSGMASIDAAALTGEALQNKIDILLDEAEELGQEGRLQEAEKLYIEVIGLDQREVRAYKGLSDVYMHQREWVQAKDVLKYASRLLGDALTAQHDDVSGEVVQRLVHTLCDLAEVYNELSKEDNALACLKQAQELDTKNPKVLDALVEQYIGLGQRLKAERALVLLRDANAGNNKLGGFEARIAHLSY